MRLNKEVFLKKKGGEVFRERDFASCVGPRKRCLKLYPIKNGGEIK
jgi:hypothetical protein